MTFVLIAPVLVIATAIEPAPAPTPAPTPVPPPVDPPAPVVARETLTFSGASGIGLATGNWTYRLDAQPFLANRGGLVNLLYRPERWDILVTNTTVPDFLPPHTFTNDNSLAEWCVGFCLASPRQMAILTVTSSDGLGLQIAFELLDDPTNAPPTGPQLGEFVQAVYGHLASVPISLFSSGTISAVLSQESAV